MTNRLSGETSPYLLQHADNPVDWHPWQDEALELARQRQQPILLSIGYSACHWCHVMAHESFEDPAIAQVMNEHFVNIKIDREERPDLDKVYQLAHQVLTQQTGGWPLTMFLDPETLLPFFGGTYFPKSARHQLPGFADLLLRIREAWTDKRADLKTQGERMREVLVQVNSPGTDVETTSTQDLLEAAISQLQGQYDSVEGGFGDAPKFPMPSTFDRMLRHWAGHGGDRAVLDMVMTSLTKMARGGIYDHLGGGFCRYATDRKWMIPHFEKMLYDNGQLLSLYADAFGVGPDPLFGGAMSQTADWLVTDMRHPAGGFFAALDADSEGEEGKYYLWRRDEIKRLLDDVEYLVIETLYGVDKPANFEGKWNLHRNDAWRSVVERLSLEREEAERILQRAREKLLAARQQRVPPGLDDKILTAWNGLAVKGLAKTSTRLGVPRWLDAAEQCMDFLRENLWDGETLHATWKGAPRYQGYLDDYANVLDALLTLLESRWREADASFALQLADVVLERFEDPADGGFFFTASEDQLIYRPKPTMDDALPPGNGIITQTLVKLGHLFGESRYLDAAHRTLMWARGKMQQYPAGHCSLLSALEQAETPGEQIIIRGPAEEAEHWLHATRAGYTPSRSVYAIAYDGNTTLPGYLPRLVSADEQQKAVAYRCEGMSCSLPITSLDVLKDSLRD